MPDVDKYLEDVAVGDVLTGPPIEVAEADVTAFGLAYDPQPFHTDPVAAKDSAFGGLIASGWHVAALVMRQLVEMRPYGSTPMLGMGIDELRWLRPVRPGDRLEVLREVVAVTRSKSKPDRGVVRTAVTVTNQEGVTVMTMVGLGQMPARTRGSPHPDVE